MPTISRNAPADACRRVLAATIAALVVSACQPVQRPDAVTQSPAASPTPAAKAGDAVIHARAFYLERMLMPPGATLDVQLIEDSPDGAHTKVLVTAHTSNLHGPPFVVDVPFDPATIESGARHGLRASLRDAGGALQFATAAIVPVVPGSAAVVEFRLVRTDVR